MRKLVLLVTFVVTLVGSAFAAPGGSAGQERPYAGQDRPNHTRAYQSHHRRYHPVRHTRIHRSHLVRGDRHDNSPH
jgi:hypothetical protein